MLKKSITYEDFDGNTQTEIFYFNLSKTELLELEFAEGNSFADQLKKIAATPENPKLIAIFKEIILAAYGEKSEDGKRFIKNEKLREEFTQTAAYNALFMELATSEGSALEFIRGILPADLSAEIDKELKTAANAAPILPPPAV